MTDTSLRRRPWWATVLLQAWLPVALIAAWWFGSLGSTSPFWPPLAKIVGALGTSFATGAMWDNLAYSFGNYFAGLAIAFVVAIVLGVIIAEVEVLRRAFMPYLDFARATPHVAFVPVIILVLGIGALPKVFLIAFGCVWPILLNTIEGIRTIPPTIPETARSFRVPVLRRIVRVTLPGALPQIVVGVRVAITVGIVMLLVSEMFGAEKGLGYSIVESKANFALADTWAGTITIGVIGYLLSLLFHLLEGRLLRWYHRVAPKEPAAPVSPGPAGVGAGANAAASVPGADRVTGVPTPPETDDEAVALADAAGATSSTTASTATATAQEGPRA